MADTKISALAAASAAAAANELAINEAGTSKKLTIAQIVTYLQANGMPRVRQLTSQHSVSSTTATKVTDLDMTLETGTYTFEYYLYERSATITVAPLFGLNFSTGSATRFNWWFQYADLSATLRRSDYDQ